MNVPVITTDPRKRKIDRPPAGSPGRGGPSDNGGGNAGEPPRQSPANMFRIGMYAVLLAVATTFTTLSSAYVYLVAKPHFWKPISMPPLVWVSTGLILLSSLSLVFATRSIEREELKASRRWLTVTLVLGLGFLAGQVGAWIELSRQGLLERGNQQRSFFLILSAAHAAHIIGGLIGLVFLRWRARQNVQPVRIPLVAAARPIALFWHAMAGIWVFLLALLVVWK